MKIGLIHSIYAPETRGGAEQVVANLVAALKPNHRVAVICVGRQDQQETLDGIKIYRVKPFNFFIFLDLNKKSSWLRFFWHLIDMFNLVQAIKIYQILKKEKPDLVLTHNLKGLGYLTPLVLKILKIKNIQTVHDAQLIHPAGLFDPARENLAGLAKIYLSINRWLFGSPAAVIFPSRYLKNVYEKFNFFRQSKKIVLGNPIVIDENTVGVRPSAGQPFQFLFLGQVEEYKGILALIAALKKIKGDFVLNIVGEGKALEKARALAGADERFKFWGRLSQEELTAKIWPRIDLLVNPSQTAESFGLVVLEAYAHGVPVLAAKRGALSELVRAGETGWLFQEQKELETKLQWLIDRRQEIAAQREICLAEAKKYAVDNYLAKLLSL